MLLICTICKACRGERGMRESLVSGCCFLSFFIFYFSLPSLILLHRLFSFISFFLSFLLLVCCFLALPYLIFHFLLCFFLFPSFLKSLLLCLLPLLPLSPLPSPSLSLWLPFFPTFLSPLLCLLSLHLPSLLSSFPFLLHLLSYFFSSLLCPHLFLTLKQFITSFSLPSLPISPSFLSSPLPPPTVITPLATHLISELGISHQLPPDKLVEGMHLVLALVVGGGVCKLGGRGRGGEKVGMSKSLFVLSCVSVNHIPAVVELDFT